MTVIDHCSDTQLSRNVDDKNDKTNTDAHRQDNTDFVLDLTFLDTQDIRDIDDNYDNDSPPMDLSPPQSPPMDLSPPLSTILAKDIVPQPPSPSILDVVRPVISFDPNDSAYDKDTLEHIDNDT